MNQRWGLLVVAVLVALVGFLWRPVHEAPPAVSPAPPPVASAPSPPPSPLQAPIRSHLPAPESRPEPRPPAGAESLLVRDARSKAPVPGARVFVHQLASRNCGLKPDLPCLAEAVLAVTDARGRATVPVKLPALHVIAAGYRWAVAARTEEGLVADLEPGSAVRLSIGRWADLEDAVVFAERGVAEEGVDPAAPASVTVEDFNLPVADCHSVPAPAPGKEATLDEGIEPGTWTYFVRRGMRDGEIYARGIVTVAEGEVAELRLDAVPMTAGPRFPVKAVIRIPGSWNLAPYFDVEVAQDAFIADPLPLIALKGLDPLNRHLEATGDYLAPGPDGLRRVILKPDLPAGRYKATIGPMGWVTEVEVSGPAPEVRIELPDPGEVRLTLLDAATGKPVPKGWVRWSPAWKGLERGRVETVSVDEESGSVALKAPPGTCHADFGADGYLESARDLSFVAGSVAEVKVTLRPAAILVARLRVGGKPFEGEACVQAELKVDEEGMKRLFGESETGGVVTSQSCTTTGGEIRLDGLWGGPHEVTVTGLQGFEAVPARRVELRFGTVTEVEIDLVPAK